MVVHAAGRVPEIDDLNLEGGEIEMGGEGGAGQRIPAKCV
jgi:hypothetical protein